MATIRNHRQSFVSCVHGTAQKSMICYIVSVVSQMSTRNRDTLSDGKCLCVDVHGCDENWTITQFYDLQTLPSRQSVFVYRTLKLKLRCFCRMHCLSKRYNTIGFVCGASVAASHTLSSRAIFRFLLDLSLYMYQQRVNNHCGSDIFSHQTAAVSCSHCFLPLQHF